MRCLLLLRLAPIGQTLYVDVMAKRVEIPPTLRRSFNRSERIRDRLRHEKAAHGLRHETHVPLIVNCSDLRGTVCECGMHLLRLRHAVVVSFNSCVVGVRSTHANMRAYMVYYVHGWCA